MQDIPNQHEISEPHIRQAERHSQKGLQHSETVAQLGKRLQESGHVAPDLIERIEDSAKTMQEYSEESLVRVEILKESRSVEDLLLASHQHVQEARAQVEATRAFLEAPKEKRS